MKLCWDNIEDLYITKNGNFRKDGRTYTYKEACKNCDEPFLASASSEGNFCNKSCAQMGKNNPNYGKHLSDKTKRKLSIINKGKNIPENVKKKISKSLRGRQFTDEHKKKLKRFGKDAPSWKGGYYSKGIPRYDTYTSQIEWCEEVRRSPTDRNILEVRCFKCNEWYIPSKDGIINRIRAIKGQLKGESNFYCSDQCKNSCSIYGKRPETLMKEDAIRAGRLSWLELDREVQPELRQLVLKRDGYQCVKCGETDKPLHCHHIYPVAIEFIESADMDNCMTLCIDCHKEAHKKDGCRYGQLNICIEYE